MATPPFVNPQPNWGPPPGDASPGSIPAGGPPAGTGPGGGDWLSALINGGLGLYNSLNQPSGQPAGGGGPGSGTVAPFVGNLVGGAYGTPTDIQGGGSNAINPLLATGDLTASQQLQQGYGNAIGNWDATLGTQAQNQLPFLEAGQTSIGELMKGISNGTFGAGSLPAVPTAPGTFQAPTFEQAQQNPGFQFAQQQGNKGILEGAGAAGGSISGGTLKSLSQFNQNLGAANYQNVFNNALQGYGANLQQYGAQLSGYNTGLNAQQQEFSQLFAPAQLGQTSANNLNANLGTGALNIGQLMSAIGSAQAAGTLGATKDYLSGSDLLKALQQKLASGAAPGSGGGGQPPTGIAPTPVPSPIPGTLPPGAANSTVTYPPAAPGPAGTGGGFWDPTSGQWIYPPGPGGSPTQTDPGAGGDNYPGGAPATGGGGGNPGSEGDNGSAGTGTGNDPTLGDNALTIGRLMRARRAAAFAAPG